MFVKICLQLFCLLKNLFFENEKTPKELFVCVSWVVGKADTEETCSAMLYKHLLQPVNSDKFQFICLEFDHPLMTDCIPLTHPVYILGILYSVAQRALPIGKIADKMNSHVG